MSEQSREPDPFDTQGYQTPGVPADPSRGTLTKRSLTRATVPIEIVGSSITVVETLYHMRRGSEPSSYESRFKVPLTSDEQSFSRIKGEIGEDWKELTFDWLSWTEIRMLILYNEEGKFLRTIPTEEERAIASRKVIEIGFGIVTRSDLLVGVREAYFPCAMVSPSGDGVTTPSIRIEPFRSEAGDFVPLAIRARPGVGPCRFSLVAIPR